MQYQYTLEPFRAEHLSELELRPFEQSLLLGQDLVSYGRFGESGPSMTVRANGQAIACIGLLQQWQGVATVWILFGSGIERHTRGVVKIFRRLLKTYWQQLGLHRLQAFISVRFPLAARFAEFFGFHCECRLRRFGPDRADYDVYALIED